MKARPGEQHAMTWDSATLDEALAAALAATADAGAIDVRATLRPRGAPSASLVMAPTLDGGPAPQAPLGGAGRKGDFSAAKGLSLEGVHAAPWTALPLLTWQASAAAGEGQAVPTEGSDAATARGAAAPPSPETPADLMLVGRLGEGGMGIVHLAHQRSLRRDVALKTVRAAADRPTSREALWREAVVMGQLDHPHIVPVHALGADRDGRPALVMKRIEGWSWQDIAADPTHPLRHEADVDALALHVEIAAKVADALAFAHDRGVLHRDVKPDNVMVGRYGEVFLADWGVATALPGAEGAAEAGPVGIAGTPAFMAPEMLLGRRDALSPRTDVFLLGAALHTAITGTPRHAGGDLRTVLAAVAHSEPIAYGAEVPVELAELLQRATAADPALRPASAGELRMALRGFLRRRGLGPLLTAAQARLAEAESALPALGSVPDATSLQSLHRLLTEARFGLMQVLAAEPEHGAARALLEQALVCMTRLELSEGHAGRARALLAELGAPHPALAAAVTALEERQALAAHEQAQLRALQRDQDLNVGLRARVAFLIPIAILGVALLGWVLIQAPIVSIEDAVRLAAVNGVVMAVAAAAVWRKVESAVNRRLLQVAVVSAATILVHRLMAQGDGHSTVVTILRDDALLLAVVASALPLPVRWLGPIASFLMFGTAMAIALWPASASTVFAVGISSMLICLWLPLVGKRA